MPAVLRLGLATRDDTHLEAADIEHAVTRGVNYLNWCGYDDGLAQAVRSKQIDRDQVVVALQLSARTRVAASRELAEALDTLQTPRIDVVTFYYVEQPSEWEEIISPGGAFEAVDEARRRGAVRLAGLTTHQRALGAKCAESGRLDLLMIRYNAAHRGAESDAFPVTDQRTIPVVAFTAQRWGALTQPTARPLRVQAAIRASLVPVCAHASLGERGAHGALESARTGGGFDAARRLEAVFQAGARNLDSPRRTRPQACWKISGSLGLRSGTRFRRERRRVRLTRLFSVVMTNPVANVKSPRRC